MIRKFHKGSPMGCARYISASCVVFLLLCTSMRASSQVVKPDYVRTPNGPNTIVDWNVKFKTMILPHYSLENRPVSQDTVGTIFLNTDTSDKHVYIRGINGSYTALANLSDIDGGLITPITAGTTPVSLTVAYSGITNPTVLFRDASGNNYTPVGYQDTGTSIVLTSPDKGDGTSADTYSMVIKP